MDSHWQQNLVECTLLPTHANTIAEITNKQLTKCEKMRLHAIDIQHNYTYLRPSTTCWFSSANLLYRLSSKFHVHSFAPALHSSFRPVARCQDLSYLISHELYYRVADLFHAINSDLPSEERGPTAKQSRQRAKRKICQRNGVHRNWKTYFCQCAFLKNWTTSGGVSKK